MARFDLAGVQLGHLMGALQGKNGDFDPSWLLDPWGGLCEGLNRERRWRVGGIAKAILDGGYATQGESFYPDDASWGYAPFMQGPVPFGLTWSKDGTFQLGLAASFQVEDQLSGQARALALSLDEQGSGGFSPELAVSVTWAQPVNPVSALTASLSTGSQLAWALAVSSAEPDPNDPAVIVTHTRTLDQDDPGGDAARILAMLLAVWLRQQDKGSDDLWHRLAAHLLPILGAPGSAKDFPIGASVWPFYDDDQIKQRGKSLEPWLNKALLDNSGLIALVWHLRALLTGNESAELYKGSICAPLTGSGLRLGELKLNTDIVGFDSGTWWLVARTENSPATLSLCLHQGDNPQGKVLEPFCVLTPSGVRWGVVPAAQRDLLLLSTDTLSLGLRALGAEQALVLSALLNGSWLHLAACSDGLRLGSGGSVSALPALHGLSADPQELVEALTPTLLRLLGASSPGSAGVVERLADLFSGINGGSLGWLGPELAGQLGIPLRLPLSLEAGPLSLGPLSITLEEQAVALDLNASLELLGLTISARNLGLRVNGEGATPHLDGLSLRFDGGIFSLRGELRREGNNYQGAAQLSVADAFSIGAIAGLGQTPSNNMAVYVFGALRAPLGGPPWFFVTGVAGGFGLNYVLPPMREVDSHPFVRALWGEENPIPNLTISQDTLWIAGGLRFSSFGLIDGLAVAAVQFDPFQIQLLGRAEMDLSPLAGLRLDIGATVDEDQVVVMGAVEGYLLHPDIASVSGQFALMVWPSEGDFAFTVGGYFPGYDRGRYPACDRLRVKSSFGALHVDLTGYVAITPRELMVGASLSLWGDFGVAEAGLSAYLDAWIKWDPWYVEMNLGVCIWVETWATGRMEIGVDLQVWTPRLGGVCEVDLTLDTLEISFGADRHKPVPTLNEVLTEKLQLVQTGTNRYLPFSAGDGVGVFGLDVIKGAVGEGEASEEQAGQDKAHPIQVLPEFRLRARTRLPLLDTTAVEAADNSTYPNKLTYTGALHSTLSGDYHLDNRLILSWRKTGPYSGEKRPALDPPTPSTHRFPGSLFGLIEGSPSSQDPRTVQGLDVFTVHGAPMVVGDPLPTTPLDTCKPEERYPLPLNGPPEVRHARSTRPRLKLGSATARVEAPARVRPATDTLVQLGRGFRPNPDTVPAGTPLLTLPASPARRAELAQVSLTVVPRVELGALRLPSADTSAVKVSSLASDTALVRDLGGPHRGSVLNSGRQIVRALALGLSGRVLADTLLAPEQRWRFPKGTCRVATLGEASGAGLPSSGRITGGVGIEPSTTVLDLGGGIYVGVGCTLTALRRWQSQDPANTPRKLSGSKVLPALASARLRVAAGASGTLVLRLKGPLSQASASVAQLKALDATLGTPQTMTLGDELLLYARVVAPAAFVVELELVEPWRLNGISVILSSAPSADLPRFLPVDLVDDRMSGSVSTSLLGWEVST